MKEQFIPYDLALKLKELGFNEECLGWYSGLGSFSLGSEIVKRFYLHETSCLAPLYQQVFDWFMEKHNLHAVIYNVIDETKELWDFDIIDEEGEEEEYEIPLFNTYKEARTVALEKLIEIVRTK